MRTFNSPIRQMFQVGIRLFSTSYACFQRPDHRMFSKVDWNQVEGGKYALVDPLDNGNILYLSPREYVVAQRTWIANDVAVVILATPTDKRPSTDDDTSDESQNSPRRKHVPGMESGFRATRARLWNLFRSPMEKFINTKVSSKSQKSDDTGVSEVIEQPAVEVNEGNLKNLTLEWGLLLSFRLFGLTSGRGLRSSLIVFADHVYSIYMTQGGLQLTKRLKIYALVLKAFLAGSPYASTQSLGLRIRLCHGLPKSLPPAVRQILRTRGQQPVRFWISLLHYYKAMVVKHPAPDISSIVANAPTLDKSMSEAFKLFLPRFRTLFSDVLIHKPFPLFEESGLHTSLKSGPNGKPAMGYIRQDLLAWVLQIAHSLGWIAEIGPGENTSLKDLESVVIRVRELVTEALNGCLQSKHMLSMTSIFDFALKMGAFDWLAKLVIPMLREIERITFTPEEEQKKQEFESELASFFGLDSEAPLDVDLSDLPGFSPYGVPDISPSLRSTLDPLGLLDPSGSTATKKADNPEKWKPPEDIPGFERYVQLTDGQPRWTHLPSSNKVAPVLTKLAFLEEPAGKVRTIAICDWWTQQVLRPLHDWLFSLLASLPSDCTFDQTGGVQTFRPRSGARISSFDLKSATEMIPQELYSSVFGVFIGESQAASWLRLLVDRWFHWSVGKDRQDPIRYRRGQPMGALSSWASMALVHHALVQFAAMRVSLFPFWDYRILGDDIVIEGDEVSDSYLEVCKGLEVPISLPKSIRSKNGFFDFASQIMIDTVNYSPISLREELGSSTPGRRVEAVLRQVKRGLIDLSRGGWFSEFLRYSLNPCVYSQVVKARNGGILDSAAKVVLTTTLGALDDPFVKFGLSRAPELSALDVFQALVLKLDIFSKSFNTFFGLGKNLTWPGPVKDLFAEALVYKAKSVRAQYLKLKPTFDQWRLVNETGWNEVFLRPMLHGENQFLAPLLSQFPTLSRKVTSMNEWEGKYAVEAESIVTIDEVSTACGLSLGEQMTPDILLYYWDLLSLAEDQLQVNPSMVLGEVPEEVIVSLTDPSPAQLARFNRLAARLDGWLDLVQLCCDSKEPILGQPGLNDPGYLRVFLELQNQGTTPQAG